MNKYIAVVGWRCPEIAKERRLSLPGIEEGVSLPADLQIAEPIGDHPDSLICAFNGRLFVHSDYEKRAKKELSYICERCSLELISIYCERGSEYPLDCGFNALALHDRHVLIGRKKSLAEPLRKLCTANTNQGYAGCTALYAGGHIITADPSIEKTADIIGIPVYKISGKDISLPGYREGFIGGAGGSFDDTVCLFGSADISESGGEVAEFCERMGLKLVCLEDGALIDRGGIKFFEVK